MNSTKKTARQAGLLYVLVGTPAVFSYQYVPRILFVPGNATATADNILSSQMLFRVSIACELISVIAFMFLVQALYRLLNGVDKKYASLMATFVLVSIPISFLNVVNELAALILVNGADFLSVFSKIQLDALAMLFLRLHSQGLVVAQIFWGLWLFPFGVLVMRSGFFPRILGVLLIIGCFTYPADSLTRLLLPKYVNVVSQLVLLPQAAAELPIMLWLLIKGAKDQPSGDSARNGTPVD